MEKEFIPYNLSLRMKELGFDEPCLMKVWWLNDFDIYTKKQFNPHITMNGYDVKFRYQLSVDHPLNKGEVLHLEIPTYSQAFKWFREKSFYVNINYDWNDEVFRITIMKQNKDKSCKIIHLKEDDYIKEFYTYEEAELACLKKLIEIVKEKI
jgi:hypothetical protein